MRGVHFEGFNYAFSDFGDQFRFDIGRQLFNVSLSRDGFLSSRVTRDCLKCMGTVPVDRERFTMVVIIERIVAETCFRRKVGIG